MTDDHPDKAVWELDPADTGTGDVQDNGMLYVGRTHAGETFRWVLERADGADDAPDDERVGEIVAGELDDEYPGVDIGPDDIVRAGSGFGVTPEMQREIAAADGGGADDGGE